jgi:hypothetical protein
VNRLLKSTNFANGPRVLTMFISASPIELCFRASFTFQRFAPDIIGRKKTGLNGATLVCIREVPRLSAILTETFRGFPQALQRMSELRLDIGHDRLLPSACLITIRINLSMSFDAMQPKNL